MVLLLFTESELTRVQGCRVPVPSPLPSRPEVQRTPTPPEQGDDRDDTRGDGASFPGATAAQQANRVPCLHLQGPWEVGANCPYSTAEDRGAGTDTPSAFPLG